MSRAALAAVLLALVACPAAAAHGGGPRGFTSTVTGIQPRTQGLDVRVLENDDRIGLRNGSSEEVLVLGYSGEPYLRFTPDAVYRNDRSPARYLNEARFGDVQPSRQASAKAAPQWKKVADDPYYEWHDHRIHWMSPILPPQVRRAEDKPHHIFDWSVPVRVGDRKVALKGSLDYEPPPSSRFRPLLIVPLAGIALAGAAVWWRRRRRM